MVMRVDELFSALVEDGPVRSRRLLSCWAALQLQQKVNKLYKIKTKIVK